MIFWNYLQLPKHQDPDDQAGSYVLQCLTNYIIQASLSKILCQVHGFSAFRRSCFLHEKKVSGYWLGSKQSKSSFIKEGKPIILLQLISSAAESTQESSFTKKTSLSDPTI